MDKKKRFLIVGGGGREGAFALRLAEDTQLYAVMGHKNPLIADCVAKSGGEYLVADSDDPDTVLSFARQHAVDYAFVSADQPLANGVVDILLDNGFRAIGGTQQATRIEWDKVYSIEMMKETCPEFTPMYRTVSSTEELRDAMREFESKGLAMAVKPQGLTGGKGVKVMPEHLQTYDDCTAYASLLLEQRPGEKVLLVEKLDGIEFTVMGITDGKNLVMSPASYDYPFRHEDDRGPGTGGMGCFTGPDTRLPFMSDRDLSDCRHIMQRIIDRLHADGLLFNGVLNGGFFKTGRGIRFMEFNGRFGDPEALNVLSVLNGSFSELLVHIWDGTLSDGVVSFARKASVVKYLVAREYPDKSDQAVSFTLDEGAISGLGVEVFFASCTRTGPHRYETLKKSRVVALGAVADSIDGASALINRAIDSHVDGPLEYRPDIGSQKSLDKLKGINAEMEPRD